MIFFRTSSLQSNSESTDMAQLTIIIKPNIGAALFTVAKIQQTQYLISNHMEIFTFQIFTTQ